jgi:2-keto-4-pentenoate hydratase/2-oxohepta-3-ene-1,7-dioic acid hydratase in catechol pathway
MYQNIRNIWCAVLNYQETANEVNTKPPSEPIFFLKAGSSISNEEQPIILPTFSDEILYELELALQFDEKLQITSAALALDLTAWDLLRRLEMQSFPWTLAKSFKNSCPIGKFFPIQNLDVLKNIDFELELNGDICQRGNTRSMIFSFNQLISYLKDHFPICPYDIVLTGTPAGVAKIKKGDRLKGKISNYYTANWVVGD